MGQTRWYSLAFFDFGSHLDSQPNPQREIERFVTIDKQLYGLYNIFGNGVITGWTVETNEDDLFSVDISSGVAIIKYMAAETIEFSTVSNLTPNSTLDIFAVLQGSSEETRSVDFIAVTSGVSIEYGIRIATIQTSRTGISFINNTTRDLVGFKALIKSEVDNHRHTGDMKIDLATEVKGQLPSARIEGIDAEKITSGVFDINRIPLKDHNDLENKGLITHAGLDSFAQTMSKSNVETMGEISLTNMLKAITFWKYKDVEIDKNLVNELVIIPGISPDSNIDFTSNTTANVNTETNCISGVPSTNGTIVSVFWDDQNSFYYNSYKKEDVIVSDGTVQLTHSGEQIDTLENFNYNSVPGSEVPGFVSGIISSDTIKVVTDSSNYIEGQLGGSFSSSADLQAVYTKEISPAKIWTNLYDTLVISVKTESSSHKPVYLKLVSTVGTEEVDIGPFTLLESNETTSSNEETDRNFVTKRFALNNYDLSNITKMVVYTDEVNENFIFFIDNIYAIKTNLVSPSGVIWFRHIAQSPVTFQSIMWDSTIFDGTNITFKVKVANSEDMLSRASYSLPLMSGGVFSLYGSCCEIQATLTSTVTDYSPILNSVELRMMTETGNGALTIDTVDVWNRGTVFSNVTVSPTQSSSSSGQNVYADVVISDLINVGGYYYGYKDAAIEIAVESDKTKVSTASVSGTFMPISPNQAANWGNNPTQKFDSLTTVFRKFDKNFIITDTKNNRVFEISTNGDIVRGFGSTYVSDDSLYPLSAIYNPNNSMFSLVFSKTVTVKDITKIILYVGGTANNLTSEDIVQTAQKGGGKVIEILLGDITKSKISGVTTNFSVYFNNGAFSENISLKRIMQPLYGARGMDISVCNFTYINGIKHPIYIRLLSNNNWIIANSSIYNSSSSSASNNIENTSQEDQDIIPDIIEIDPTDGSLQYSSDFVKFSDYSLGSIIEYDSNRLAVVCIKEESNIGGITGQELITNAGSNITSKVIFRAEAIDALKPYKGSLTLIDKLNDNYYSLYTSPDGLYPTDLDMCSNGDMLVSESSFADSSGRLIKIDSHGNVVWTYGNGMFNIINDAKILSNNNIMVSI